MKESPLKEIWENSLCDLTFLISGQTIVKLHHRGKSIQEMGNYPPGTISWCMDLTHADGGLERRPSGKKKSSGAEGCIIYR